MFAGGNLVRASHIKPPRQLRRRGVRRPWLETHIATIRLVGLDEKKRNDMPPKHGLRMS